MFDKVLIANRGEIACRIIRACRSLGLKSVAVCSEADAAALHAEQADERVVIGSPAPRDSYLRVDRILDAARRTGANAIHPGYGFLSESEEFASAVMDAGLVWIGPDPGTIAEMGHKSRARGLAEYAGVPVVPGSAPLDPSDAESMSAAAAGVGYPLLVKAAAGGGGIGMVSVDSPDELGAAALRTRELALRYFGDGAIYLERFVPTARHVEVQIMGDGAGNAVHLFDRDCSMQRRFQKIIEESPAPGLDAAARSAMLEAAVRLAASRRYRGPGTVEFIVDAATQEFFFLEMNTRIQVEHPVTEMVTGIDLVATQLRIARGDPWPLRQDRITQQGHAIECRIYAEDPRARFRPSTGTLTAWQMPETTAEVRVDTGYRAGDRVTPYYDPLLAKLIVHGSSRDSARELMARALATASVRGVKTNLELLGRAVSHPDFAGGRMHTRLVENAPELWTEIQTTSAERLEAKDAAAF
jgi:3-methylcrotonyl-CoA carboxylase alpha subunit